MNHLLAVVRNYGIKKAASEIPTSPINLRHYVNRRYHKIGKQTRRLIRTFLVGKRWIVPSPPLPKHECPICNKVHTISRKQSMHIASRAQLELVEKVSATGSQRTRL